jgi:hypothetical protein
MAAKPKVFVGSSLEAKPLAVELCKRLGEKAIPIGWWQSPEFANGYASLDALLKATEVYDFAVFLFTPDDDFIIRDKTVRVPRDNVVFEYGLFLGRLRQGRVLAFVHEGLRLPSDVAGIQMERFDQTSDKHQLIAATSALATVVSEAIERTADWWNLYLGDVIESWSIDLDAAAFGVSLSGERLKVRASTFLDKQLVLVIRREDNQFGPMHDTRIGLGELRRYTVLDDSVRLVAKSDQLIGSALHGTMIEARVFLVPAEFTPPATIEEVIARGGRLVGGVKKRVERTHAV